MIDSGRVVNSFSCSDARTWFESQFQKHFWVNWRSYSAPPAIIFSTKIKREQLTTWASPYEAARSSGERSLLSLHWRDAPLSIRACIQGRCPFRHDQHRAFKPSRSQLVMLAPGKSTEDWLPNIFKMMYSFWKLMNIRKNEFEKECFQVQWKLETKQLGENTEWRIALWQPYCLIFYGKKTKAKIKFSK